MSQAAPPQYPLRQAEAASRELVPQQTVEVRIRAHNPNIWVVGIIVGTLQFISNYACLGYEVEYHSPSSGYRKGAFPQKDVRPYQNENVRGGRV